MKYQTIKTLHQPSPAISVQLNMAPTLNDLARHRLRMTPGDCRQLRPISDDSGQLRLETTPTPDNSDSRQLRLQPTPTPDNSESERIQLRTELLVPILLELEAD